MLIVIVICKTAPIKKDGKFQEEHRKLIADRESMSSNKIVGLLKNLFKFFSKSDEEDAECFNLTIIVQNNTARAQRFRRFRRLRWWG